MRTFSLAVIPKPIRKKIATATQKTGLRSWYRISNRVIPKIMSRLPSGRAAERGEGREIDVLEPPLDRLEALGLVVGEDVDYGIAGEQARRDDVVAALVVLEVVAADHLLPDLAASVGDE